MELEHSEECSIKAEGEPCPALKIRLTDNAAFPQYNHGGTTFCQNRNPDKCRVCRARRRFYLILSKSARTIGIQRLT